MEKIKKIMNEKDQVVDKGELSEVTVTPDWIQMAELSAKKNPELIFRKENKELRRRLSKERPDVLKEAYINSGQKYKKLVPRNILSEVTKNNVKNAIDESGKDIGQGAKMIASLHPMISPIVAGSDLLGSFVFPNMSKEQKRDARINAALEAIPFVGKGINVGGKQLLNKVIIPKLTNPTGNVSKKIKKIYNKNIKPRLIAKKIRKSINNENDYFGQLHNHYKEIDDYIQLVNDPAQAYSYEMNPNGLTSLGNDVNNLPIVNSDTGEYLVLGDYYNPKWDHFYNTIVLPNHPSNTYVPIKANKPKMLFSENPKKTRALGFYSPHNKNSHIIYNNAPSYLYDNIGLHEYMSHGTDGAANPTYWNNIFYPGIENYHNKLPWQESRAIVNEAKYQIYKDALKKYGNDMTQDDFIEYVNNLYDWQIPQYFFKNNLPINGYVSNLIDLSNKINNNTYRTKVMNNLRNAFKYGYVGSGISLPILKNKKSNNEK